MVYYFNIILEILMVNGFQKYDTIITIDGFIFNNITGMVDLWILRKSF